MSINDNLYVNGFGATSGDDLLLDEPWYTDGTAIYVDSADGSDSNSGVSRIQPKQTLAAGITAASSGDYVILLSGFSQTLTAVQLVTAGITIVAEGTSGGQPTATLKMNSASAHLLDITGGNVELRNIKFVTNTQANASAAVRVGDSSAATACLIKGCRFEGSVTDTGSLLEIKNADRLVVEDTTVVMSGTAASLGVGILVSDVALANLTLQDIVLDGGTGGWAGGVALDGSASTMTFVTIENMTLLRGSDVALKTVSSGRVNVSANDSSRVIFS